MRLSPGLFTNLDWLYEVRNGRAFTANHRVGASVGNFSEIQLFNPVGSAVTVIIHEALIGTAVSDSYHIRTFDTALATDVKAGTNLNSGGAASVARIRSATPAAADGTLVRLATVLATTTERIVDDWWFVLGAGEGVLVVPGTVNELIDASFEWIEF